jgi:1-phosphatidylinositol-5-phosphate 4-kinase
MSSTAGLKKKRIRVKRQKVKVFRASEPLISVFMWGVNHSVSRTFYIAGRAGLGGEKIKGVKGI